MKKVTLSPFIFLESLSLSLSFHSKKRCLEGVERNRIRRRWRCSAIPFLAFGEVIKERRWRGWIDRKSNSWRRDGSSLAVLFIRREGGGLEIGGRARQARSYVWHPTIRGVGWAVIFHPFRRENFIYGISARPTTFFKLIYCRETRYERQ